MRSGLISLPASPDQIGHSSLLSVGISSSAIAIVLTDRFVVRQSHLLSRASLGQRLLYVLSIGVLWVRWR